MLMIKLVITDMDGTLMSDTKEIHPSFWEVHQQLVERGIIFAVASGRQVYNLEEEFANIKDDTLFIAENGTIVRYKGRDVYINELDKQLLSKVVAKSREVEGIEMVVCGRRSAYVENDDPKLLKEVRKYYHRLEIIEDLTLVEDEIVKIAIYDSIGSEINSAKAFAEFSNNYKVTVSGPEWLDISNMGASKGDAIRRAQEKLGIAKEETMAFGDYLNDYEMLQESGLSYAMKNSHPDLLKVARFVTEYDNNNNGVVETIRKVLLST